MLSEVPVGASRAVGLRWRVTRLPPTGPSGCEAPLVSIKLQTFRRQVDQTTSCTAIVMTSMHIIFRVRHAQFRVSTGSEVMKQATRV